jgi:hypothetical protein
MDTAANTAADGLRDMYAMHTLFRREFGLAPALVRDVREEDVDQAAAVCEHIDIVLRLLMIHHERQDSCRRFYRPGRGAGGRARADSVVPLVKGQHAQLHAVYDEVTSLMQTWRASASVLDAKSLALAFERLTSLCNEHMALREEQVLWPRTASLSFRA